MNCITKIVKDPIQKVSVVLLSDPEEKILPIELISPLDEGSPISNILRKGIHLYHLCFSVENLDVELKKARKKGAIIVSGPVHSKLYNGKRIAFIYLPDGYVVELLETKTERAKSK